MNKRQPRSGNLWEKTSVQCLLRHSRNGRYYGRFKISGKQKWVALETDLFSIAKLRVADEAAKFQKIRGTVADVAAGDATMGQLIEIYRQQTEANSDLRPKSIAARLTAINKVLKTWPGIDNLKAGQITAPAVQAWAARFKKVGTNFVARNAKKALKGNSPSSVNRAIDALRWVLDMAVERGQIHTNPARIKSSNGRLKKKVTQKKLVLPCRDDVPKLFTAMENIPGWGHEAADFCRFMMMSGARLGEISLVTWKKVDWQRKQLHLPGYKTETSDRHIPLFPPLETFLNGLIERRKKVALYRKDKKTFLEPNDSIFCIRECQKSIDSACVSAGVHRITHHDFRHLFATAVIESGVDIPTLSRWLGHNDGGVLAMKTYGHLRMEHSQQSAQKVVF